MSPALELSRPPDWLSSPITYPIILYASFLKECSPNLTMLPMLTELGLIINQAESQFIPTKKLVWLGVQWYPGSGS